MRKKYLIEINGEEIKIIKEDMRHLKKKKNFYCNYDNKDSDIGIKKILKRSNLNVILEGEEIFIHRASIPKMSKTNIELLIKNKVIEIFHNIENIIFTYKIISRKRKKIEIIIYCINIKDSIFMREKVFEDSTIKSVIPIQQLYIDKYSKKMKNIDYTMIIYRNKYVYIAEVKNNILSKNKVISKFEEDSNLETLEFLKSINDKDNKKGIYIINEDIRENIKIANFYEIKREFSINC
ncbi:MAG: hypothetical protein ACLSV2_04370 [Clostridium sp.]